MSRCREWFTGNDLLCVCPVTVDVDRRDEEEGAPTDTDHTRREQRIFQTDLFAEILQPLKQVRHLGVINTRTHQGCRKSL